MVGWAKWLISLFSFPAFSFMFPAWYDCVNSTVMLVPSCAHGTITRQERIAQPAMRTSYAPIVLHACSMLAHVIHVPVIRHRSYSYYPVIQNCDHPCLVSIERMCKIASSTGHVKEWWLSLLSSVFNASNAVMIPCSWNRESVEHGFDYIIGRLDMRVMSSHMCYFLSTMHYPSHIWACVHICSMPTWERDNFSWIEQRDEHKYMISLSTWIIFWKSLEWYIRKLNIPISLSACRTRTIWNRNGQAKGTWTGWIACNERIIEKQWYWSGIWHDISYFHMNQISSCQHCIHWMHSRNH